MDPGNSDSNDDENDEYEADSLDGFFPIFVTTENIEIIIDKLVQRFNNSNHTILQNGTCISIYQYDLIVYERNRIWQFYEKDHFDEIFETAILKFYRHKDIILLNSGIRLLYICPSYFLMIDDERWVSLVSFLIRCAIYEENPISINALRCLNYPITMLTTHKKRIPKIKNLFKFLLNTLKNDVEICKNTRLESSEHDQNENGSINTATEDNNQTHNKQIVRYNFAKAAELDIEFCEEMMTFHKLILLDTIIKQMEAIDVSDLNHIWNILYHFMNSKTGETEIIISASLIALQNILRLAKSKKRFCETYGIQKLCQINPNLSCNPMTVRTIYILLSQDNMINYISKKFHNLIAIIISHALHINDIRESHETYVLFMNIFKYSCFVEEFNKQNGIMKIFDSARKYFIFSAVKGNTTYSINVLIHFLKVASLPIKYLIQFLIFYLSINFQNKLKTVNQETYPFCTGQQKSISLNYQSIDPILLSLKKLVPIRDELDFMEAFSRPENIEIIICIVKITHKSKIYPWEYIFCDCLYLLRFISIYEKSLPCFLTKIPSYPILYHKKGNIINHYKYYFDKKDYFNHRGANYIFEIYINLIIISNKWDKPIKELLKSNYIHQFNTGLNQNGCTESMDIIITEFINNGLLLHLLEYIISFGVNNDLETAAKAIKLLCFLSINERLLQLISTQPYYFYANSYRQIIFLIVNSGQNQLRKYIKYSWIMIKRINVIIMNPIRFVYLDSYIINKLMMSSNSIISDEILLKTLRCVQRYDRARMGNQKTWIPLSIFTHNDFMNNKENDQDNSANSNFLKNAWYMKKQKTVMTKSNIPKDLDRMITASMSINTQYNVNNKFNFFTSFHSNYRFYSKLQNTKYYYSTGFHNTSCCVKIIRNNQFLEAQGGNILLIYDDHINAIYHGSHEEIINIETSNDEKLILGCSRGRNTTNPEFSTLVWRYSEDEVNSNIPPLLMINNLCQSKITNDCSKIFGLNRLMNTYLYDLEKQIKLVSFKNSLRNYCYPYNVPDMNTSENLILSNGELYCTRSGKLIHIFDQMNFHISGTFLPSDNEIISNHVMWDLRTFKLLNIFGHLNNTHLKRINNNHILLGAYYDMFPPTKADEILPFQLFSWSNIDSCSLYDCQTLQPIWFGIWFKPIKSYDLSKDGTCMAIQLKSEEYLEKSSHHFLTLELGEKSFKMQKLDGYQNLSFLNI